MGSPSQVAPPKALRRLHLVGGRHWPWLAVAGAYLATAVVIPVGSRAWATDDWVYARSVDILLHEHRLHILDLSVATLVFQVVWGALFAGALGFGAPALRLSTMALVAVGGVAAFALARELGVGRSRAALAAAAVLFNPLAYVLGFTYMTDQPFAALLTLSCFLYVRGVARDQPGWTVAGSVAAGLAFLVRHPGALIPVAVLAWLLAVRRLRFDREGAALAARVAAVPAAAAAGYFAWLVLGDGIPAAQRLFLDNLTRVGFLGVLAHALELAFVQAMYVGLFVLPLVVAAAPFAARLRLEGWARRVWGGWCAFVLGGVAVFALGGRAMPYVPQFLAPWGLGPEDVQGGRPPLAGDLFLWLVTALTAASAILAGRFLLAALGTVRRQGTDLGQAGVGAGIVAAVLAVQAVAILPPSLHFRIPVPGAILTTTLDRYLLPLLPLAVCLVAWALRGVRLPPWPAWGTVAVLGLVAVVGTRDYLVFKDEVWLAAASVHEAGVELADIDGGAAWDGAHLYVDGTGIPQSLPDRPWWINLFAPDNQAVWVVAGAPLPGYEVVDRISYSSWLAPQPQYLYVLRQEAAGDT